MSRDTSLLMTIPDSWTDPSPVTMLFPSLLACPSSRILHKQVLHETWSIITEESGLSAEKEHSWGVSKGEENPQVSLIYMLINHLCSWRSVMETEVSLYVGCP